MKTALIIIDVQNDYFPGGALPLAGAERAGANAGRLLAAFREKGLPVVHIQHVSAQPGAGFFLPETQGVEIHEAVRPAKGEAVVVKHFPNSFRGTDLEERLRAVGAERLVIAGMMSHMCVDATTRAAFDLGFDCTVAHDTCATFDQGFEGVEVAATAVHAAFMSALGAVYARVAGTDEIISELR